MSVSSVSCRINAVEEVHTSVYALEYVGRRSYSHQISRLFLWKVRYNGIQNTVHLFMAFPYRQASHCISVQFELRNLLGMLNPDVLVDTALVDTEQHLLRIDRIGQGI